MLVGQVPPEPGLSYDVMVNGENYEPSTMVDAQWPLTAFDPVVDSLLERHEPSFYPLRYLEKVALKYEGQPLHIERYSKGIYKAGYALSIPLMICVKEYKTTFPDGVKIDWTFKEATNDYKIRVSNIEVATSVGALQGEGFEALFPSWGVVGLGPSTQDQRTKYAFEQLKLVFHKSFPADIRQMIADLVETQFPMYMGTPFNHIISLNEGEKLEVFVAHIDSLGNALQRYFDHVYVQGRTVNLNGRKLMHSVRTAIVRGIS